MNHEEIKKDLEFAQAWFDNMPEGEPICEDELDTIKDILGHVRSMLDENERLRDENLRLDGIVKREKAIAESCQEEAKKFRDERDMWLRKAGENGKFYMDALAELAEKDKVLEWYAEEDHFDTGVANLDGTRDDAPITLDKGERARSILSQYKIDPLSAPGLTP